MAAAAATVTAVQPAASSCGKRDGDNACVVDMCASLTLPHRPFFLFLTCYHVTRVRALQAQEGEEGEVAAGGGGGGLPRRGGEQRGAALRGQVSTKYITAASHGDIVSARASCGLSVTVRFGFLGDLYSYCPCTRSIGTAVGL